MVVSLAKTAFRTSKREYFAAVFAFFIAFSVFLFVDSLSRAVVSQVELEARPVLGADVVASSNSPFTESEESAVFEYCEKAGAECSKKISFSSTLSDSEGKTALVQVVGVEPGYPYYGNFEFAPFGTGWSVGTAVSETVPSKNGFLSESSLISRFASEWILPFFWKTLQAEGVVRKSSETGFSFGDDNGTVYVSYASAVSVPEITTLSRAQFSILAKTPNERDADALTEALKSDARLSGLRIRSFRWGASGAARIIEDVSAYASEAVAAVFFLAWTAAFFFSKAVWISNRKYFSILRMLGASRFSVASAFVAFFLSAASVAAALSALVALFVLDSLPLPESFGIPTIGIREILRLAATFPFVVLPAAVPWIVSVFSTSPLSWLGEPKISLPKLSHGLWAFAWTFLASFLFLVVIARLSAYDSLTKALGVVAAIACTLVLSFGAIRVSASIFKRIRKGDFAFADAVRLAVSPGSPAFPVVSAFVVPAVLLASFSSLAFHFSSELERMSHSWYDVFALNLKASDAESVQSAFPKSEAFSIIRARVVKINGKTLREHLEGEPSREFSREFNITSSPLPDAIVKGEDRPLRIGEVSLDDEFSRSLGITVGDDVTFSVMGREFELKSVNVRQSDREGVRPFFYFSVAEGEFAWLPPSYFVAASVPDTERFKSEVLRLSGSYVSFVDVRETVEIVRSAADRILPAVWAFFMAIAALSVTVAIAALSSLKWFRAAREKTYRAVGATKTFLRKQAFYTLSFYAASAFLSASVVAFPAVWWGIASVSFLAFSYVAALKAVAVLFGFLIFASLAVAGFETGK